MAAADSPTNPRLTFAPPSATGRECRHPARRRLRQPPREWLRHRDPNHAGELASYLTAPPLLIPRDSVRIPAQFSFRLCELSAVSCSESSVSWRRTGPCVLLRSV